MEMLDFVAGHYQHALLGEHLRLIGNFRDLPLHARCLYVRLVNRKGRVFAANKLRYPELGEIQPLLQRMREGGWVESPHESHYQDVLNFLTKAEIGRVLSAQFTGLSPSLRKGEMVSFASQHCQAADFMARLNTDQLLVQGQADAVGYVLFLYFGRVQDGLSQFTMRDLGLVRSGCFKDSYEPRFGDRDEALVSYFFASRLHRLTTAAPDEVEQLCNEAMRWPRAEFSAGATLRDRLAYGLGRKMERSGDSEAALSLYELSESAKSSERIVRILFAAGRQDDAERHLVRCIDNPRSDEEALMAQDLYARKLGKRRTSAVTDELRQAEAIDIDESCRGSPEQAAVEYYGRLGLPAFRSENLLWRSFFGLLFWDELFAADDATLHSPFEFLPAALADGSFYERFRERIEERLQVLDYPVESKRQILRVATGHYGTPNAVFRWRRSTIETLFVLLDHVKGEPARLMLRRMCMDFRQSRHGYPDLMLIDSLGVRFIEIKTEGDQLRRNQLLRLRQLRAAGFRADAVRVRWVLDPRQVYVVVDVETTGGRGEQHRVTEIGAVKLQGGEIVDRFHSLLNPQRTIPSGIVRLTGITPAMVADAPIFADVADEFEQFMRDAIFVAHNVDFDYRFIALEFRRIGRPFRHPRLCTCSSMRTLFPGHQSYSLGALCANYRIKLRQHHRAMSDAEAAAELLLLINEKRSANLPGKSKRG